MLLYANPIDAAIWSAGLASSILIISVRSLCHLSLPLGVTSLDTNGPDNQTFYNHLLPPSHLSGSHAGPALRY